MNLNTAIYVGIACYGVLMLSVSLFFTLRLKRSTDYLVAGRTLPFWALVGTTVGTGIGTGVAIGAIGLAYQYGWAGGVYPIGLGLGTIVAGVFFSQMRRHHFMTLGEEIACYYGGNKLVVEFSNIGLFVSQLCWLTVQIMGGAAVLGIVTGLPREVCTVISGVTTALICLPGGLKTVVYTDFLQAAILLLGFCVLSWVALVACGGFAGLQNNVPDAYFSLTEDSGFGSFRVTALILALCLGVIADPGRRLTMYSAQSERGAKWSMITGGIIIVAFSVCVGVIGMYAFILNPNLSSPDQALPWLVTSQLPVWLAAMIVVAIISAVISSATTNAAAAGTFFVRHVFPLFVGRSPRQPVLVVRRAMGCAFLLATGIAFYPGSIVEFVIKFLPMTMSGLAVVILLGRFWSRATWQGALAALATVPIVTIVIMLVPDRTGFWLEPGIPATIAGLCVHIVASLFTRKNVIAFNSVAENMKRQRDSIESANN